jgi:hypothetical protein
MLGQIDFADNVWESSAPGTIYKTDETGDFFSIAYSMCRCAVVDVRE